MEVNIVFLHGYVNNMKTVIPVPYQVRDKFQRESRRRSCESRNPLQRTWVPVCTETLGFPHIKYGAGLVKSGMTQCVKSFLRHYAEIVLLIVRRS